MKKFLLPMIGVAIMYGTAWSGVLPGEGTAANPYVIASAADWNIVADDIEKQVDAGADGVYANTMFKLAGDIDFTGTVLKPWALFGPFEGCLDGGSHAIKGYDINAGKTTYYAPVGWLGADGEIKNLTVAGTVSSDTTYVGGLVGSCEGTLRDITLTGKVNGNFPGAKIGNTTTYGNVGGLVAVAMTKSSYYNCINKGIVTSYAGKTGGIIGEGGYGLVVDGCENQGTVSVPIEWATAMLGDYVGGVVGYVEQSTFTNCVNNGKVYTPNCRYVGGILGYGKGDKPAVEDGGYIFRFENCVNYSDMECYQQLAGIYARTGSNMAYSMAYVKNCHNHGNLAINYSKAGVHTSGVAGIAYNIGWGSTYRDCTNTGNISAKTTNYIGGLFAGCTLGASTNEDGVNDTHIINCHNYGNITSTRVEEAAANAGGGYIGGIVGSLHKYMDIDSCSNSGNIYGVGCNIGGIVGYVNSTALLTNHISNCYNTGNMTGGLGNIGGIVGSLTSTARRITLENCWNAGDVVTTGTLGGTFPSQADMGIAVGGIAGTHAGLVQNCYNVGLVKGVGRVGGIVGAPTKNYTTVFNCYNAGKIEALADSCGSIIGVDPVKNGKEWNTENAVINCYYITDFGTYSNDSKADLGTAVSIGQLCKTDLGESFTSPGENCMPVLTAFSKDQSAQLYSAAVVPATGDTYLKITKDFSVGTPDGTVWSASNPAVAVNGNAAKLTDYIDSDVVMTAKLGDYSKELTLHIIGGTSGIDSVTDGASADVVAESWYSVDGRAVATPAEADGGMYIVVQQLSDGTTRTVKKTNR